MMYFNNLDAPLPIPLVTSVETLLAYLAGSPRVTTFSRTTGCSARC